MLVRDRALGLAIPMTFSEPEHRRKLAIGLCVVAAIAVLFVLLSPYMSLEYLETQRANYQGYYERRPLLVLAVFVLSTATLIGLSLPMTGATLLLGGALFGFPLGTLAGGLASTLGATLGFLWTRYLFRAFFQDRYSAQLAVFNRGVEREGWFYVFGLRLMMFPYFLVNMLCALTSIRASTFVGATLASQLIVAAIWAYAGSRLGRIEEGTDLLSFELVIALLLVGVAPLGFNRLLGRVRHRQATESAE